MTQSLTIETDFHVTQRGRGARRVMATGPDPTVSAPVGRLPRIARLMALAIRFEQLIQAGEVTDYAELARLGHVTRARVTQIMNLLLLAPDLQEKLLFLPRVTVGKDSMTERDLRPIAATADWGKQRAMWELRVVERQMLTSVASPAP